MLQIGRRADFPMASAIALILMAVVTLAYIACARWLRIERLCCARLGGYTPRPATRSSFCRFLFSGVDQPE